jgi:hypothetical protein
VVAVLENHFVAVSNPIVYRYELFQRAQGPDESVEQYVTGLRGIVKRCGYADAKAEAEAVRDQLVFKCRSNQVRKALLDVKDLTLNTALEKARHVEAVQRDMGVFSGGFQEVYATSTVRQQEQKSKSRIEQRSMTEEGQRARLVCLRCGRGHTANDSRCSAKDIVCFKCGKVGHLKRMCKSGASTNNVLCDAETAQVNGVGVHILSINVPTSQHLNAVVQVGKSVVTFVVDSGSQRTLITRKVFNQLGLERPLLKPDVFMTDAQGGRINCHGYFEEVVGFKDRSVPWRIYVVDAKMCLLGLDLMKELRMTLSFSRTHVSISTVDTSKKMPCVKGFVHEIVLKPGAEAVKSKLRPLPFSVREKVAVELKKWEEMDIIERVHDACEWVSPIVVAAKKDGAVRVCVDLRNLNRQIVTHKYPLPSLEELFVGLAGATHFTTLDLSSAYLHVPLTEQFRQYTSLLRTREFFVSRGCHSDWHLRQAPFRR